MREINRKAAIYNVAFAVTGIAGVLNAQYLDYKGLSNPRDGLMVLAMFLGMALTCTPFVIFGGARLRWDKRMLAFTILNVIGETLGQFSIAFAGSGLYIVIYSSNTVFVALYRRIFLGKTITLLRVCALLVIIVGQSLTVHEAVVQGNVPIAHRIIGIASGFGSALVYAGYYVLGESLLTLKGVAPPLEEVLLDPDIGETEPRPRFAIEPTGLGAFEGLCGSAIIAPYVLIYAVPRWNELVTDPIENEQTSGVTIGLFYAMLCLWNGLHIWACLMLFRHADSIVAGVNKSVQAVSIFAGSSVLYCSAHQSQCLTAMKGASIAVVLAGVIMYSVVSGIEAGRKRLADAVAAVDSPFAVDSPIGSTN